jgi:hypothetical protein
MRTAFRSLEQLIAGYQRYALNLLIFCLNKCVYLQENFKRSIQNKFWNKEELPGRWEQSIFLTILQDGL